MSRNVILTIMAKNENAPSDPAALIMQNVLGFDAADYTSDDKEPSSVSEPQPETPPDKPQRTKQPKAGSRATKSKFPSTVTVSLRKDTAVRLKALKYTIAFAGGEAITLSDFVESLISLYLPKLSKKESALFKALLETKE